MALCVLLDVQSNAYGAGLLYNPCAYLADGSRRLLRTGFVFQLL